ncbi:uncharacterized protein ARMOST_20888 [Armillaria ostoyae]|uniref:Uncharacterized protein n=1 Tax=Armillaria ostoyae TaxID=47428 RepID=A0A284S8M8_ARMOS|nr:uncharacterized protein ARMOST_20888 [Armillaria ostoyae]
MAGLSGPGHMTAMSVSQVMRSGTSSEEYTGASEDSREMKISASKDWRKGGDGVSDQSTMLGVTNIVEVGAFLHLPVADQRWETSSWSSYDFTTEGNRVEVSTSILQC